MTDHITDNLLSKIDRGDLKMRPRWHFGVLAFAAAFGFALVFGITFFLVAFIMLTVRTSGLTELPGFGWDGALAFLQDFPWFLALLLLALMAALELYARRFPLAYKRRAMTSLGILVILLGGTGIALGAYIERICPEGGPMDYALGSLRAQAAHRSGFVQHGVFVELRPDMAVIVDDEGAERQIPIGSGTHLLNAPAPGDDVVIFGRPEAGQFHAKGLRVRVPSSASSGWPRGLCSPKELKLTSPADRSGNGQAGERRFQAPSPSR
jgi:hypothetical protein